MSFRYLTTREDLMHAVLGLYLVGGGISSHIPALQIGLSLMDLWNLHK